MFDQDKTPIGTCVRCGGELYAEEEDELCINCRRELWRRNKAAASAKEDNHMSIDEVLSQLSSLKDNSKSMARTAGANSIWHKDIEALEAAIVIISALRYKEENK